MPDFSSSIDAAVSITWQTVSGNTVTTEQGSGVLISPDEVLTAAHLVYAAAGGIASGITVKGSVAGQGFSDAAASVHAMPDVDWTQVANAPGDFAVIHLATPVSGASTMALGSDVPGSVVTVTGYPVSAGGAQSSLDEALSTAPGLPGVLEGTPLGLSGDPHGASGGPAWILVDGVPTVVGLTSSASGSTGYFVDLTPSDVAQIDAWTAADHATSSTAASSSTSIPTPSVSDEVAALSSLAGTLPVTSSHPGIDAALSRVAALLTQDAARLGASATFQHVATNTLAWLGDNSSHRNLAAALLEGIVWGHDGGGVGSSVGAVAATDPGIMSHDVCRNGVHAGAALGHALVGAGG